MQWETWRDILLRTKLRGEHVSMARSHKWDTCTEEVSLSCVKWRLKSLRARAFGSESHPKVHIRPSASITEELRLDTPEKRMVLVHMTYFLSQGFSASHNEYDLVEFAEFAEFSQLSSQNKNFAFILPTSRFYELRVSFHQKRFLLYIFIAGKNFTENSACPLYFKDGFLLYLRPYCMVTRKIFYNSEQED